MTDQHSDQSNRIREKIRDIVDFPKKGILFKDITPVLKDPETLKLASRLLLAPFETESVDIVAGIESRGFLLGPRLATDLNAGFVPVRKPGKLPADTISETYQLEYGTDALELHADAIKPGDRVIIHDDLMATGGSARAASNLIRKLGGTVVGYSFIVELTFLNGRSQLETDVMIESLVKV
ncbi:adenine phosphoribosyltransferase [Balneolales bacterium ANBcel1]|nr:adenine phosphoribosyltransferase [Balneolales bacterium ANBcel1]